MRRSSGCTSVDCRHPPAFHQEVQLSVVLDICYHLERRTWDIGQELTEERSRRHEGSPEAERALPEAIEGRPEAVPATLRGVAVTSPGHSPARTLTKNNVSQNTLKNSPKVSKACASAPSEGVTLVQVVKTQTQPLKENEDKCEFTEDRRCTTHNLDLVESRVKTREWKCCNDGLFRNIYRFVKTWKCPCEPKKFQNPAEPTSGGLATSKPAVDTSSRVSDLEQLARALALAI